MYCKCSKGYAVEANNEKGEKGKKGKNLPKVLYTTINHVEKYFTNLRPKKMQ